MTDIEGLCRSLLQNAAARQWAAARAEPEEPSVDYLTGFGAGWEAGQVSALALVVAMVTGESATGLIEDARSQAAMDAAFPFDLFVEPVEERGGGMKTNDDVHSTDDQVVPCPTCWLLADVLPPGPFDAMSRSRCPRGHENTLPPAVLAHLRSLLGPAFGQTA